MQCDLTRGFEELKRTTSLTTKNRVAQTLVPTCDVVDYPAVSRLTALAQATVPLIQQTDGVLGKTCPQVSGRN